MTESVNSILWRRLDTPGHDACHIEWTGDGWVVHGVAAFLDEGRAACLAYKLTCDRGWRTRRGSVRGWIDARRVDVRVKRERNGIWTMNDEIIRGLEGCVDLDFGFTPATNVSQVRRIALAPGAAADVPVAWLDVRRGTLEVLGQRYERRSERGYWYEARFGYAAELEVSEEGFATRYPGLWEEEARHDPASSSNDNSP